MSENAVTDNAVTISKVLKLCLFQTEYFRKPKNFLS